MKIKIWTGLAITIAAAALLFVVLDSFSPYRIADLAVREDKNPPSFNGVKSSKAMRIDLNVVYRGMPKRLDFTSTCQNAELELRDANNRKVPKINTRMCGEAFSSRNLKAGDRIEASELFDLTGFKAGSYTVKCTYQDALSFERRIEIR